MTLQLTPTADDLAHFQAHPYIDDAVKPRILLERAVIRRAAGDILASGLALRLYDGEGWATEVTCNLADIMAAIQSVDDERLYVLEPHDTKGWVRIAAIYLVYGNDGWDVMADYSTNLEMLLAGANEYAEQLADQVQA